MLSKSAKQSKTKNSIKLLYIYCILCAAIIVAVTGYQVYKSNQKLRELSSTNAAEFSDPFSIQLLPASVGPGQSYQINASQNYTGSLDYQLRRCDFNNANCVTSSGAYPVAMQNGIADISGTLTTNASPGIYNVRFKPSGSTTWSNEFAQTVSDPAVVVTPAATTPRGKYRIQFYSRSNLNGQQVFAKTWKCTNRLPKSCTAPTDGSTILKKADGTPFTILNNSIDVDLNTFNGAAEGLYYFQLRPQNLTQWSSIGEVNITTLAKGAIYDSVGSYEQAVKNKLTQVMQNHIASNPLGTAPGVGGATINSVLARNLNADQTVYEIEKLLCGEPPFPINTDPQSIPFSVAEGSPRAKFALWSDCASAQDYLMMLYFKTKNDPARITSFAYAMTTHHEDMISSTTNNQFGFINPPLYHQGFNYGLEYTPISYVYTNDAGMGTLGGLGWLKSSGYINELYCTTKEFPYQAGANCKTINLYGRIRDVTSAMSTRSWNTWYSTAPPLADAQGRFFKQTIDPSVNSGLTFQAYNSAGMALEAKLARSFLGQLHIPMINKAATQVSNQFARTESSTNFPVTNGIQYIITSDNFQHLGVMGEVFDWIFPQALTSNARVWANVYLTNYFDKTQPLVDLSRNSYIAQTITTNFPNSIGACGVAGKAFYTNPNGVVVASRGEHASDAIITSAPSLYYLLKQSNQPGLSIEVLDSFDKTLDTVLAHPLDWREELCDPSPLIGIVPKTQLSVNARIFAGYYFAIENMNQSKMPSFTPVAVVPNPTPSPTPTLSPSPSPTRSPSPTPTLSPSPSPARSPSPTPTPTVSPSPSPTRSPSPSPTNSPVPTPVRTNTPVPTATPIAYGCSNQNFYTVHMDQKNASGQPLYTYTKDCMSVPRKMYLNEDRFSFFVTPTLVKDIPFIKTENIGIKDDKNLQWSVTIDTPALVYVLYRKIPGQSIPAWLSPANGYTKKTNDDFSNLNQYLLRKNELGLIGVYDIYEKVPLYLLSAGKSSAGVTFGPASDANVNAYSMYQVGIKPVQ